MKKRKDKLRKHRVRNLTSLLIVGIFSYILIPKIISGFGDIIYIRGTHEYTKLSNQLVVPFNIEDLTEEQLRHNERIKKEMRNWREIYSLMEAFFNYPKSKGRIDSTTNPCPYFKPKKEEKSN